MPPMVLSSFTYIEEYYHLTYVIVSFVVLSSLIKCLVLGNASTSVETRGVVGCGLHQTRKLYAERETSAFVVLQGVDPEREMPLPYQNLTSQRDRVIEIEEFWRSNGEIVEKLREVIAWRSNAEEMNRRNKGMIIVAVQTYSEQRN
jgi:hypothetical protein